MSTQNFQKFVDDLGRDEALRKALEDRHGSLTEGVSLDDLSAFGREKGYEFTVEDTRSELSDEEMARAAGGAMYTDKSTPLLMNKATPILMGGVEYQPMLTSTSFVFGKIGP